MIFGCVLAAHLLALIVLGSRRVAIPAAPVPRLLTATLIFTNNSARRSLTAPALVAQVQVLQHSLEIVASLAVPAVVVYAEPNSSAVRVAPQLLDDVPPDMAIFARQAGLLPGESAVVVLRVEVMPNGQAGDVQVDVSSGSRQVDEAASAYARAQKWVPGRWHGLEERVWVRYGVRLAA